MNGRRKQPSRDDLRDAAEQLRNMLKAIPSDEDRPRDAMVRRRIEGAIVAAEIGGWRGPASHLR